ncbi:MAG: TIGR04283 family arsenosugar biosynthesis glycosyltransferase [Shimia sp.]|uniref:TIGR04283 family arsenosugar biosynthesis glycosyltransferase n=1 Tax=Shimia sp. TaxID=1954381 RepID=UPI001B20B9D9|nr:TIGR04283 family arsenosugar biosynthesis glycosyltransferase [Shimia sp.]MBO6897662.1 TIGR04283 family arsenosugar biosynthesis glycosyltransferase [Shimia sp.]
MRAPVSVVIPTLNEQAGLPACLGALFEGVSAGMIRELIVADGGSEDDTLQIAEDAGAKVVTCAASRGGQMRTGAEKAQGEWLLFVHADTVLSDGWSAATEAHLQHMDVAGYYALRFEKGGLAGRFVAGWANLRSRWFGLPYGDQGLLISRQLYEELGGFADIPLMEDVAIARQLGRRRLVRLDVWASTSPRKYQAQGWLRRGGRNLWTLLRYLVGVAPETLAAAYRRQ